MSNDNRRRALGEVVSLEAWHAPFSKTEQKVDLCVDVAFLTGRLGGEAESEVWFELQLQQAEILVVIPPSEPAKVDVASVSRDAPQIEAKLSRDQTVKTKAKTKISGKTKLGLTSAKVDVQAEAETGLEADNSLRVAVVEAVKNMRLLHSLGPDGHHRWTVSTPDRTPLHGRPWNAAKSPRLKVIDQRTDRAKGLPPAIQVEVRCRREDLMISNIALKQIDGLGDRLRRDNRRNKEAAAEAVIRTRLFEEGLLAGDSSDRFAILTLASVTAQSD